MKNNEHEYENLSPVSRMRIEVLQILITHFRYNSAFDSKNIDGLVKQLFEKETEADFARNTLYGASKPTDAHVLQAILDQTLYTIERPNDNSVERILASNQMKPIRGGHAGKKRARSGTFGGTKIG